MILRLKFGIHDFIFSWYDAKQCNRRIKYLSKIGIYNRFIEIDVICPIRFVPTTVATDTCCITGIFFGCLFSAVFWNMKNPQKLKSQNILKLYTK